MHHRYPVPALVGLLAFVGLLSACGGGSSQPKWQKQPIDDLIKQYSQHQNYQIILYDMDYDEASDQYRHQYEVQYEPLENPDTLLSDIGEFTTVSDTYFNQHVDDMGMALVSKTDGELEKAAAPPGYSRYVGNERYGQWRTDNSGNRFWEFYGKYAFMRSMFGFYSPVRYGYWNDYHLSLIHI